MPWDRDRPSKKLKAKFYGPFKILEQTSPVTFKLELPRAVNIHPIFHVGLLKPHHEMDSKWTSCALPAADKDGEYEIEKILAHRHKRNGPRTYLVKWKGYSYEESTWEPQSNFKSHTLKAYHDKRKAERAEVTDSSSGDEADDEPPTKTRRAAQKRQSAGSRTTAKLNTAALAPQPLEHSMQEHELPTVRAKVHAQDTYTQSRQVERLNMLACEDCGHRWTCKLQPPKDPAPAKCRKCEQRKLSVISEKAQPTPLGNAALSTAFDEAAAAWGAKMKETFGTVIDSRISTEPPHRMDEHVPQGNSHHRRCGAIDWHKDPTPNQCSRGSSS